METAIDRFGRIIIPKNVREEMGLEAGALILIEKQREKLS